MNNATTDVLHDCSPLTQSLFLEVYNHHMWEWYREWGLVQDKPRTQYLIFNNGNPVFRDELLSSYFPKGIIQKTKVAFSLPKLIALEVRRYQPTIIDELYAEPLPIYSEEVFTRYWATLIENFKYAILASLIAQYNIIVAIPEQYHSDIQAQRYNAVFKLIHGAITRDQFNKDFGFYAINDYEFSNARYAELPMLRSALQKPLTEHPGPHQFREHIKLRSIKLVARIRYLLLSTYEDTIFQKTKDDILQGAPTQTQVVLTENNKPIHLSQLVGKKMSGKGTTSGRVVVIHSQDDYTAVQKGDIVVTATLPPDLVTLYPLISGIIAEQGSRVSHAAIVAREYNIPLLGEVQGAMTLQTNQRVCMNLDTGTIQVL